MSLNGYGASHELTSAAAAGSILPSTFTHPSPREPLAVW